MNRRILIVFVILIIIIGGGVYYWLNVSPSEPTNDISQPALSMAVDQAVISPVPSFDGSDFWYFNERGRLFKVKPDGTQLSEFPLPEINGEVRQALWPTTGSNFILVGMQTLEGDLAPREFKAYYDSVAKLYIYLRPNIQSLDWMPDGRRIVYVWKSGDGISQSLVLADADGSGFQTIVDLFWSDLVVKVSPDAKHVLLYRSQVYNDLNKIYTVNLETKQISTVVDSGENLEAMWVSPNKFIYTQSTATPYGKLFIHDLAAQTSKEMGIVTNLNKVVLDKDGKYLYVALPRPDNSGDDFTRVNLETLATEQYHTSTQVVRAINLMLLGNKLYFVDARDNKIYKIEK